MNLNGGKRAMAAAKVEDLVRGLLAVGPGLAGAGGWTPAAAADPPALSYWHLWADGNGRTHQTRCRLDGFAPNGAKAPDTREWMRLLGEAPSRVAFGVQEPGYHDSWHVNPEPQLIVPLAGRWAVTSTDGTRVEMGPGEMSFGEDQRAATLPGGERGHLSSSRRGAVLMFVRVARAPAVDDPCPFR